jgi:hypothetical protein
MIEISAAGERLTGSPTAATQKNTNTTNNHFFIGYLGLKYKDKIRKRCTFTYVSCVSRKPEHTFKAYAIEGCECSEGVVKLLGIAHAWFAHASWSANQRLY